LDALGRPREARWWLAAGGMAVIEMAEAAGLQWLDERERDPLRAGSFGVGRLIQAALDAGAAHVLLCVGGSATVDGGAGCLQALGWKLLDDAGGELAAPAGGGDLSRVRRLVAPTCECMAVIEVLCDVDNPLIGPRGAAPVFAPQKGASQEQVCLLAAGLENWAAVLDRSRDRRSTTAEHVGDMPFGGAAGGLPAALASVYGAHLVSGVERIAELVRLPERLAGCDLCLTGEGRIDAQTEGGKTIAGVARCARAAGVPVVALVGAAIPGDGKSLADLGRTLGLEGIVEINPPNLPLAEALPLTGQRLTQCAFELTAARASR
jgi:glycerate kinase